MECLLSFGAQSFVLEFGIKIYVEIKIHRTIIFCLVLCECEALSVTLREEHMLKAFMGILFLDLPSFAQRYN
jgi:hypothetical protein